MLVFGTNNTVLERTLEIKYWKEKNINGHRDIQFMTVSVKALVYAFILPAKVTRWPVSLEKKKKGCTLSKFVVFFPTVL